MPRHALTERRDSLTVGIKPHPNSCGAGRIDAREMAHTHTVAAEVFLGQTSALREARRARG